jgi:hypothetical protein
MEKSKKAKKQPSDTKVEKVLIENFVSLQKVMTNLAVKFDSLSGQISKLLELFELSAKTLAEKDFSQDKKLSEKLDNILDQNKIIAKGVSLLHERNSVAEVSAMPQRQQGMQLPLQREMVRPELRMRRLGRG